VEGQPTPYVKGPKVENYSTSAVRTLQLIEYFSHQQRPLRAHEIAKHFQWQTSSTAQILKSLVHEAYLTFNDRTKLYQPAPRLVTISSAMGAGFTECQQLHSLIEGLSAETGETVALTTRYASVMQVLDVVSPDGSHGYIGAKIPLLNSLAGLSTLSQLTDHEMRRILRRFYVCPGPWGEPEEEVMKHISEIRSEGFGFGGFIEEMSGITLNIPDKLANVPLVLGIAGRQQWSKIDACGIVELVNRRLQEMF
jgi:DNA-binding IclR family transcriptional regulator